MVTWIHQYTPFMLAYIQKTMDPMGNTSQPPIAKSGGMRHDPLILESLPKLPRWNGYKLEVNSSVSDTARFHSVHVFFWARYLYHQEVHVFKKGQQKKTGELRAKP